LPLSELLAIARLDRDFYIRAMTMNIHATIVGIVPFDIQDERYLTIYYVHDDEPDTILQARLPASAVYEHPHPNDEVSVHYVLGVVTQIVEREESGTAASAAQAV
jgi:hypothetical protein